MKGVRATEWVSVLTPGDGDPRHGWNGYSNLGCRCEVCRDANNQYGLASRERRASKAVDQPHGVESTYFNYKCRCAECREEHRIREAARRARRQARAASQDGAA